MLQTWRWIGPEDPVPLDHIRQAGATGIVTSLHHIPTGEAWCDADIQKRKTEIEGENHQKSPLYWHVVESVNVHDDIKVAAPGHETYIKNYCETLKALGRNGIRTVCYNFMPLIDWTRTDLAMSLPSGAEALGFDADKFAAFDLFILERDNASEDYSDDELIRAEQVFSNLSHEEKGALTDTILAGLPGGTTGAHNVGSFKTALARYQAVSDEVLRENLVRFLEQVIPTAEAAGVRLAIHPDDPPRPMLGLPRVLCTAEDVRTLFARIDHPANGLTLCAGTFGVRPDNDVPAMAEEFADRIYFSHLRGTSREPNPLSFHEADHLNSDVDMLGLIKNLLEAEKRRPDSHWQQIPIRPDHGHRMLDDLAKSRVNPGYTAIGRLKGLAEIRGAIAAMERFVL
jgi:mannonate dehydratase